MAANEGTSVPSTAPGAPAQARGNDRSRGRGRGRGRGDAQSRTPFSGSNAGIPSDRGQQRIDRSDGRGGGNGTRGGRGNRRVNGNRRPSQSQAQIPTVPNSTVGKPPPQPGGAASLGGLTKDAANDVSGENASAEPGEGAGAGEVCFICGNIQQHQSVTPCNHRYCTVCSLRMRALYKTKACAYCRTELPQVIFTDDPDKKYENFDQTTFYQIDGNMGIAYEQEEIFQDTVVLLRYNCPDPHCDIACMGWPDLHRHVRSVHHKHMCDLCTRNKKVFTHEQDLFTQQELKKHEKYGDDTPGAIDQTGFKGHPDCGFCRIRFYGEDELYVHCRDNHERCHLCDRRTGGRNPQYYLNYEALEAHFSKDHWPCLDSECQEKKFVVFDSEMDLKAHQLENHPNGMSKDVRRDARRVDISSFDYRPQYQEVRRGGRRGGGRGRDPNSEPMPATSGGQMSRAEMAHQREREIHSTQPGAGRTFGGQLSRAEPEPQTVAKPPQNQSPRPTNAQPSYPSLHDRPAVNAPPSPRPAEQLTPQEQARRLRHSAVTDRAANLLGNDQLKLNEFRERISSFRNGTITASDLIEAFFSLFDTTAAELGKLIKELADIFELPGKRDSLLEAWNDWKAINEDYPSLPGPSGVAPGSGAGMGGARVLKLKSSTAASSRSAMGQQRSWGAAAAASNNPFPSLPPTKGAAAPAPTPGWLTLKPSATGSKTNSAKASPAPSRSQSSANLKKDDLFPALPAAQKPTSTVFSPGYTGSGVIRPNTGTPVNAWSASGLNNDANAPPNSSDEVDSSRAKGRKGKNVVFKWG